jgi:tetratricopeptide (TPR) repeat protein
VCARLDGIPLALELAAAQTRVLPVAQLAARLDGGFTLLTGGARTAPTRQRTLEATVDWSYALLEAPERALFARLAVFAGGWTLEAAEAVCAAAGRAAVFELLARLVDKSLVQLEEQPDGTARYRLLEPIRQYARARLAAHEGAAAVQAQHAAYYLALAEQAELELKGVRQGVWLRRLEREHDNLRAALRWFLEHGGLEPAARMGEALWRFWRVRGHLDEFRAWVEDLLGRSGGGRSPVELARPPAGHEAGGVAEPRATGDGVAAVATAAVRAVALRGAAQLARTEGDSARAVALLEQSLALRRRAGDRRAVAAALVELAMIAVDRREWRRAAALLEESLTLRRQAGDAWGTAEALHELGIVAREQGDWPRAEALLEEALALQRELRDDAQAAWSLYDLGILALRHPGDAARAVARFEASLGLWRALGFKRGVAQALGGLASIALREGDGARAAALWREGLALWWALGATVPVALCLESLAAAAAAQEQFARAARLLGAAEAWWRQLGGRRGASDESGRHERAAARARAALGAEPYALAWTAGHVLPPEQAIAYALALDAPAPPAAAPAPLAPA